ncbi:MAG: anti-sigma factor [Dongiaceae bacterium]
MTVRDPDRTDRLAGEYTIGTMRGNARRRFERLIARDPDIAARVAAWEARLQPLTSAVEPVAPAHATWQRIERSLDGTRERRPVGLLAFFFARPRGAVPSIANAGLWYCLNFWRNAGIAGSLAALVLIAVAIADRTSVETPAFVAVLETADAPAALLASYDPDAGTISLSPLVPPEPAAEQAFELWLIAPDSAPESMGLVTRGTQQFALPAGRDSLPPGSILAISVEPPGGSPTGQATGPIILQGAFHAIEDPAP